MDPDRRGLEGYRLSAFASVCSRRMQWTATVAAGTPRRSSTITASCGVLTRGTNSPPVGFSTDYDANAIWIADDPSARTVEVARTEAAIIGEAESVLVDGFVVEKFANPAQRGAIQALGPGWRIQNNEIRLNHGHGVFSGSAGGQVVGNHLHHNGQLGLGGER